MTEMFSASNLHQEGRGPPEFIRVEVCEDEKKGATKMAGIKTAVFGIYSTASAAEHAVDALDRAGFPITDISILVPESIGSRDMGTEKKTKAPEGAAAGAGTGALFGGTLGLLVGVGALAVPGVGPLIAAGPIVATLAGIGVGGTVGGLAGALIGLGIPEFEAKRYEGRLQRGGILLSVHCDSSDEVDQAKEVLKRVGANDVSSTGEASTGSKSSQEFRSATARGSD